MNTLQTTPQRGLTIRKALEGDTVAFRRYPAADPERAIVVRVEAEALYLRLPDSPTSFLKRFARGSGKRLPLWLQNETTFVYVE